ncbi:MULTISPECIES: hypothetical protein [Maricaulis]|jgi:hypothetical protein|uniref:Lipoprotein n=1 Tax=Maricaulis maris (strain MCS10) TaxID=394221 RepID=Q0AN05_MARMM|nr:MULTISPECIES: hypothetical protein [Maricaulis]ABI66332.1 conserved hypothetical protein [Maricaulis maris MCS10]MAC88978.1 hypothetical protein [Maricaulis sp.]
MKTSALFAAGLAALFASACTSTPKVDVRQPGDRNMSCAQLEAEMEALDDIQEEAENNQGVNTANVAAVVFFWPAAVGNYMEADRAMDLAEERQDHLMDIYTEKNCDG